MCATGSCVDSTKHANLIDSYRNRNYRLFSVLAGVRPEEGYPQEFLRRGFPHDASSEVAGQYAFDGVDAHSASWATLESLMDYDWASVPGLRSALWLAALETINSTVGIHGKVRLVFWFDN